MKQSWNVFCFDVGRKFSVSLAGRSLTKPEGLALGLLFTIVHGEGNTKLMRISTGSSHG